jgi:hypothetical protein
MKIEFPYTQYGITCPDCNETIFSNSRHDFVTCNCGNHYIDGGFDYIRTTVGSLNASRVLNEFPPYYFRDEQPKGDV